MMTETEAPWLDLTVEGTQFLPMLADATKEASDYFGAAPFRAVSFRAAEKERIRSTGGVTAGILYEAHVQFEVLPSHPVDAPDGGTPDPEDEDDTAEVNIT